MLWEVLLCVLSMCAAVGAILGIGYHDRQPGRKEGVCHYAIMGFILGPIVIPVIAIASAYMYFRSYFNV